MLARLTAFVIWGLVAATAVFWGLRLLARPQPAPAYALAVGDSSVMRGDLGRLLGAAPVALANAPVAPELSSRFKLLGIMAPKQPASTSAPGPGFALIAVDGKPARAFAVGASLDAGLVLQAVSLRTASIGPARGAPAVRLEMPPLPVAATGTLPALGDGSAAATGAVPVPPPPAPGAAPARPPLPVRPPGQPVPPAGGTPRPPGSTAR
jgi:general secretion pathway protein C